MKKEEIRSTSKREYIQEGFYALVTPSGIIKVYETHWLANRAKIEIFKLAKVVPCMITYEL
jgi:hypothetical protein